MTQEEIESARSRGLAIAAKVLGEDSRPAPCSATLLKEKAFEWSVDYKPWEEGLSPQDYARHGYEQGYAQAMKDLKQNGKDQSHE